MLLGERQDSGRLNVAKLSVGSDLVCLGVDCSIPCLGPLRGTSIQPHLPVILGSDVLCFMSSFEMSRHLTTAEAALPRPYEAIVPSSGGISSASSYSQASPPLSIEAFDTKLRELRAAAAG